MGGPKRGYGSPTPLISPSPGFFVPSPRSDHRRLRGTARSAGAGEGGHGGESGAGQEGEVPPNLDWGGFRDPSLTPPPETPLQTKCFICGIGSDYFDTTPHGFETHTLEEHNLANYM